MTVEWHNRKENDYTVHCDNCGSEEICDHQHGIGKDLESIDYCAECCPKCESERERDAERDMAEAVQEAYQ